MAENFSYTFTGSEIKCFFDITLYRNADDNTPDRFQIEAFTISSFTLSSQTQTRPRAVLGRDKLIGVSTGVRLYTGSLVFEVFDENFFYKIKEQIKEFIDSNVASDGTKYTYYAIQDGKKISIESDEAYSMMSLPSFDVYLIAVKADDPSKSMQKVVKNVTLTSNNSALGIHNITIQEAYDFICSGVKPFVNTTLKVIG